MSTTWHPQFLFTVCQTGAEAALKHEIAAQKLDLRPSYSRPGFVTFKFDQRCENPQGFQLRSTFARTWGFSLGKVSGAQASDLAFKSWQLPAMVEALTAIKPSDLHVWERDRVMPGEEGFEPGPTALAAEVDAALTACTPVESLRSHHFGQQGASQPNTWILDAVVVEPCEWWLGCHLASRRTACWIGGVPPIQQPEDAVSRAYLKMTEALEWSALPFVRGDICVELGCSPGGAAQALLEKGLFVVGIDPAEVDPLVAEHPSFLHVRRRSLDVPKRDFQRAKWLTADMNVAPGYTLEAVEDVVLNKTPSIRGLVLTLKLADWSMASQIGDLVKRVRSWGYRDVRTRHLAFNRQEFCLVALKSRAQRRIKRGTSQRRIRTDAPHQGVPGKMHVEKSE
ncbi:SAM-dependent methyltransferase [Bythopirellula polymerisocia]|uniref:Putative 23S rRNA ribose 2'-O-ribose methyltransferase n=1 Tax=Bythopirellula polymerisocia TaxID=2528003 RepID=A0A5C6CEK6_9BACT|nr:SAM-dependent methyltransferase [Bythopirellula polymerisocia]TWU21239.1 putative 23S rRNA ribose 2'-O-ribose methyltransferase [Bythopirellula polymerisocia]